MCPRVSPSAATRRVALAVAVLAAACSSGSSPGTVKASAAQRVLDAAARATRAAGSARFHGEIGLARGARAPLSGAWSGDLASGRGTVTATLAVGGAAPADVELRWTGGQGYVRRVAVSAGARPGAGDAGFFTRTELEKPWAKVPVVSGLFASVMRAFAPVTLLDQLRAQPSAFAVTAGERLNGTPVTHVRNTRVIPIVGLWPRPTLDLWIDARDRLVRLAVVGPDGGGLAYDVSGYGAPVDVSAPPAADIATVAQPNVLDLAGPYTTVRSGTTAGVAWALQEARASDGRDCWKWAATPPITQVVQDRPDGARCVTPPEAGADPSDAVQIVVDADSSGPYDALAVLLPPHVKDLTLGFVGGRLQPLAVESPLVWVGPASPMPAYLGVTLVDGTTIGCGAGAISTPADLGSLEPDQLSRLAHAPWACIPVL